VAALEVQLTALTEQLRQRRETVPSQTAQRLEEHNRNDLGSLVTMVQEEAAHAEQGATTEETRLAMTSALEQCTSVSTACAEHATSEVNRALEQANETAAQIGATLVSVGGCPTATDLAIAPPGGHEKENLDAAAALRRRREAQQQAAADLQRHAAKAPFLTM